jgi:hypothetical protein
MNAISFRFSYTDDNGFPSAEFEEESENSLLRRVLNRKVDMYVTMEELRRQISPGDVLLQLQWEPYTDEFGVPDGGRVLSWAGCVDGGKVVLQDENEQGNPYTREERFGYGTFHSPFCMMLLRVVDRKSCCYLATDPGAYGMADDWEDQGGRLFRLLNPI